MKTELKRMISQGKTKETIHLIIKHSLNEEIINSLTILLNRLERINFSDINGTIDKRDMNQESNSINDSLIKLIDNLSGDEIKKAIVNWKADNQRV